MNKLNAAAVNELFLKCIGGTEGNMKVVEGVTYNFGFDPAKLEENKEQIKELVDELPEAFRESEKGGWSFLCACEDKHGNQWGEHTNIQELMTLGMAIGYIEYLMPREFWKLFPGSMPYFVIKDSSISSNMKGLN